MVDQRNVHVVDRVKIRCPCGRWIATLCSEGIKVKCHRCKATALIPNKSLFNGEQVHLDLHRPKEVRPLTN